MRVGNIDCGVHIRRAALRPSLYFIRRFGVSRKEALSFSPVCAATAVAGRFLSFGLLHKISELAAFFGLYGVVI